MQSESWFLSIISYIYEATGKNLLHSINYENYIESTSSKFGFSIMPLISIGLVPLLKS